MIEVLGGPLRNGGSPNGWLLGAFVGLFVLLAVLAWSKGGK